MENSNYKVLEKIQLEIESKKYWLFIVSSDKSEEFSIDKIDNFTYTFVINPTYFANVFEGKMENLRNRVNEIFPLYIKTQNAIDKQKKLK